MLSSDVVDLDAYTGKKIIVYGALSGAEDERWISRGVRFPGSSPVETHGPGLRRRLCRGLGVFARSLERRY